MLTPNVSLTQPPQGGISDLTRMRRLAEESTYITTAAIARLDASLSKDVNVQLALMALAEKFEKFSELAREGK